MGIALNTNHLKGFVEQKDYDAIQTEVTSAHNALHNKTGPGSEFTGWVNLPSSITSNIIDELTALGNEVAARSDCVISIGIGGSYLGIRSTIEALGGVTTVPLYYAGHNISGDELHRLLEKIKGKRVTVVVISKSGTTTEPAIAFRVIKEVLSKRYSAEELRERIVCVTDASKGALRAQSDKEGYRTFVIPDDIGGRFSVLTPVGLVPLAMAGVDIKSLVEGAQAGEAEYAEPDLKSNTAYRYAAARSVLNRKGKDIEMFASFYPELYYIGEWWKQLFGESEGKNGKGVFPASTVLSTDLHSMGQLMQDGKRNIFETFLMIDQTNHAVEIPAEDANTDNFNCIAGKDFDYVNKQAYKATAEAHFEGGCPNMTITLEQADAYHIGQLYYFYEKAVAISGYMLGVNPFDQPGVEAYKKKMFALLGLK